VGLSHDVSSVEVGIDLSPEEPSFAPARVVPMSAFVAALVERFARLNGRRAGRWQQVGCGRWPLIELDLQLLMRIEAHHAQGSRLMPLMKKLSR
jgi:hypothetical protein